tara:strand:+ start:18167 stop:19042 length:876 start_codon:yes stop_codon:yes gene_type:complete
VHLAGIVPVAGPSFDFGFDWHDCLMPIEKDYTAIERAVYECAMVGCHTIWIIANNDMQPLIKNRIGEWIQDPVWYGRSHDRYPTESRKEIPIYYAPIHPKDRDRRDSLGWSVLYGAYVSYTTSYALSSWLVPHKYYCAFPYGVYDAEELREHRAAIANPEKNIFTSYNDRTVKDNEYLSFTFNGEDFKNCRNYINQITTRQYYPPEENEKYPNKRLPVSERWSAKNFDMSTVFKMLSTKKIENISLSWYYPIDSWDNYKQYMSSNKRLKLPSKSFRKPRGRNKLNEKVSQG